MEGVPRDAINEDSATHYVVCMLTIHVGMPKITTENVEEFYRRVEIMERDTVLGPLRANQDGPIRLTLEECRSFVGLRTNATPYTGRQFNSHVLRIQGETVRRLDRVKRQEANAKRTAELDADGSYKIVRHFETSGRRYVMRTGLTLAEAQAHCNDPETSSSTCTNAEGRRRTRRSGRWFDGYTREA